MFVYLLLVFILIPSAELYLIVQASQWLGAWNTVALILFTGVLGSWLAKQQGLAVWRQIRNALARGVLPAAELFDGLMVLVGGALLITPGFLTDTVGFALMLPWLRRQLAGWVRRHVERRLAGHATQPGTSPPGPASAADAVIDVEARTLEPAEEEDTTNRC